MRQHFVLEDNKEGAHLLVKFHKINCQISLVLQQVNDPRDCFVYIRSADFLDLRIKPCRSSASVGFNGAALMDANQRYMDKSCILLKVNVHWVGIEAG